MITSEYKQAEFNLSIYAVIPFLEEQFKKRMTDYSSYKAAYRKAFDKIQYMDTRRIYEEVHAEPFKESEDG